MSAYFCAIFLWHPNLQLLLVLSRMNAIGQSLARLLLIIEGVIKNIGQRLSMLPHNYTFILVIDGLFLHQFLDLSTEWPRALERLNNRYPNFIILYGNLADPHLFWPKGGELPFWTIIKV